MTCEAEVSYTLNEPGRQNTSLYVVASRVTALKGLFLCEKLTKDDFEFFRPSESILREEERLDVLCAKPLIDFNEGNILLEVVNGHISEITSLKRSRIQENQREKVKQKISKLNFSKLNLTHKDVAKVSEKHSPSNHI